MLLDAVPGGLLWPLLQPVDDGPAPPWVGLPGIVLFVLLVLLGDVMVP